MCPLVVGVTTSEGNRLTVGYSGISHFVKNHFIVNHKVDQRISVWSLSSNYSWRFLPMVSKKHKVCRVPPEVLEGERTN